MPTEVWDEPIVVRCNHCMHVVDIEHFESCPEDQICPECGAGDALMDMTLEDVIASMNSMKKLHHL